MREGILHLHQPRLAPQLSLSTQHDTNALSSHSDTWGTHKRSLLAPLYALLHTPFCHAPRSRHSVSCTRIISPAPLLKTAMPSDALHVFCLALLCLPDFLFMLMCGGAFLMTVPPLVGFPVPFTAMPLILMIIYVWSRNFPDTPVSVHAAACMCSSMQQRAHAATCACRNVWSARVVLTHGCEATFQISLQSR